MLDFTSQKKILDPILKTPGNHNCADCNSVAPTWASLDFGVFVCSNCSGAHRGLGPTITRVRSANLDKWQQVWIQNMRIGNDQLNAYWESDVRHAEKKPKASSSLQEISRYVFEKYIKRKWIPNRDEADPLTLYKTGQYQSSKQTNQKQEQSKVAPVKQTVKHIEPIVEHPMPVIAKKADVCLIDFDFEPAPAHTSAPVQVPVQPGQVHPVVEEEFTEYTQAVSTTAEQGGNLISFDALLNQQQAPQPPPQQQPIHQNMHSYQGMKAQNMQMHHPYNPHIAQHNLVYQGQYQQQPMAHQGHQGQHQQRMASMPHGYHQQSSPHQHQQSSPHQHQQPPAQLNPTPQGTFW